jgi:hypothetical protein
MFPVEVKKVQILARYLFMLPTSLDVIIIHKKTCNYMLLPKPVRLRMV